MTNTPYGQIIVLNGTPRAGKSSLASAMQRGFPGVWLNLGLECFKSATPERHQPGIGLRPGGERPDLEPLVEVLYLAMYESIAAHSRRGVNVVADTTHHDHYSVPRCILPRCAMILRGLPALLVGVRCPLEVVMARRQATWGWSYEGDGSVPDPILRWQRDAHVPGLYDLEVDTSTQAPDELSAMVWKHLTDGPEASAFRALARLAPSDPGIA